MVEKELWVCLQAYNLIRLLMAHGPKRQKAVVLAKLSVDHPDLG
jgi:hypothetical protein